MTRKQSARANLPGVDLPLLQSVEGLNDLLSEAAGLETACTQSLKYVLGQVNRTAGGLFVQMPGEAEPCLVVQQNLPESWLAYIQNPGSPVRHLVNSLLENGDASLAKSDAPEGLAAAIPIPASNSLQGVLLLQGGPCRAGEIAWLQQLVRPIGRAIRGYRNIPGVTSWELLRSRNTLRALFDSMPAALYIVDRQYNLVAINRHCSQRAGQPPQALVSRRCYDALYHRSAPCNGCRVAETLLSGESFNRNEHRWGKEEEPTEWEINSYPIYDDAEGIVQAILLEQDVTEKHRLETILAQSEKLAAVGQLAAGVAHEINNPLTAIIANAQILQRELPPDSDLQESADLIARAGARATQVVRNLLDFARKEQYILAPTDINETIQHALALVQHELLARAITLTFEPGHNLPLVQASQDQLQGVWLNLMMNAVDAIDKVPGRLTIATQRVGKEIHVRVTDNGKGIPADRLERVFEPFYTTKAAGHGTGLGLSVCNRVVKQHNGQILVTSQIGVGSEFTVILPIA